VNRVQLDNVMIKNFFGIQKSGLFIWRNITPLKNWE